MGVPDDVDSERLAEHALERAYLPGGGPELQLCVTRDVHLEDGLTGPLVEREPRNRVGMAAVEALGEPQHGGQGAHGLAVRATERPEIGMAAPRFCTAVISGDEGDPLDLVGVEAAQIAVPNQVLGVAMVLFIADVDTDVVEQRRELEPLALAVAQPVDAACLVEEREGEARDLRGMGLAVIAALGQLDDTATPDVGHPLGLDDCAPVLRDVVEHEALAQRQIAERDLAGLEALHDRIEEHRARDGQVRAPGLEAWHPESALEIHAGEELPSAMQVAARHTLAAAATRGRTLVIRESDRPEALNRAGRAHEPIEPSGHDPIEVRAHLTLDVTHQLALVAR